MTETSVTESESHVYVPEGVESLLASAPPRVRNAALQIAERIAMRHNPADPKCGANLWAHRLQQEFPGQIGTRNYDNPWTGEVEKGERRHIHDIAIEKLRHGDVIAVRDAAKRRSIDSKGRPRCYVLTAEYADRPRERVTYTPTPLRTRNGPTTGAARRTKEAATDYDPGADDETPARELPPYLRVPAWASACTAALVVDLAGCIEYACRSNGVGEGEARELAARLDMNGAIKAIKALIPCPDCDSGSSAKHECPKRKAAKGPSDTLTKLFMWRVDGRDPRIHRDEFGHRLHTPITSLDSEYRGFLGFGALTPAGSNGLVKIDAKNAQYVFAAHLAAKDVSGPDVDQFVADTSAGRFYEATFAAVHDGRDPSRTTMVDYHEPHGYVDPVTKIWCGEGTRIVQVTERDHWKKGCQGGWLFADAEKGAQEHSAQAVAARGLYPTVHQWVLNQKLEWVPGEDGRIQPGGTKALPRLLQRIESSIFIETLIPALESARIPVIPIHDAVLVPDVCADQTLEILRAVYAARGMRAEFDVERIERPALADFVTPVTGSESV